MSNRLVQYLSRAVAVAAVAYLAYRLATYDRWAHDLSTFDFRLSTLLPLAAVLLLMPLNMLLEALRWRLLIRDIQPLSVAEASRAVYYGTAGAVLTPARLGEYPTRALLLHDPSRWPEATLRGLLGSLITTLVITLFALPSLITLSAQSAQSAIPLSAPSALPTWDAGFLSRSQTAPAITQSAVLFLLSLLSLLFLLSLFLPRLRRSLFISVIDRATHLSTFDFRLYRSMLRTFRLSTFDFRLLTQLFLLTALRYLVWCLQLYLILYACSCPLTLTQALTLIPFYYLLVTFTPSIPAADPAVRGTWLIVAMHIDPPAAALAATLIWTVNTLLPVLIGVLVKKTSSPAPDHATSSPVPRTGSSPAISATAPESPHSENPAASRTV